MAGTLLLASLSGPERAAIAQRCAWRRVARNEMIICRHDDSRALYWIVEGRARIVHHTAGGREVVYAETRPGDHVGELAALDGWARRQGRRLFLVDPAKLGELAGIERAEAEAD